MQYYLAEDIFSHAKRGLQYGKKGELVTEVVDAVEAVIVENVKGNRYTVNKKKLILKSDKK